jgi:hypothetical protein
MYYRHKSRRHSHNRRRIRSHNQNPYFSPPVRIFLRKAYFLYIYIYLVQVRFGQISQINKINDSPKNAKKCLQ